MTPPSIGDPRAEAIIDLVCNLFVVPRDKVLSPDRHRRFCLPRQIAMVLILEHLGYGYERTGLLFERDRTTAFHAYRTIYRQLKTDRNLALALDILEPKVKAAIARAIEALA